VVGCEINVVPTSQIRKFAMLANVRELEKYWDDHWQHEIHIVLLKIRCGDHKLLAEKYMWIMNLLCLYAKKLSRLTTVLH